MSTPSSETRTEVADDGSSYRVERTFDAAPARVFDAFVEPADLRVWFPAAAPPGSELTECRSDSTAGGAYRYVMEIPEHGRMSWHGRLTDVERPERLAADEWFVVGDDEPTGEPSRQVLTFDALDGGRTRLVMDVRLSEPSDPAELRERDLPGLAASLDALARLVEPADTTG